MSGGSAAFLLCVIGALGVGYELLQPYRILPGVAGLGAMLAGAYLLGMESPTRGGLALLAAAALLLAIELIWHTAFVAGTLATVALGAGLCQLIEGQSRIQAGFAVPAALAFGTGLMFLAHVARQARINKRPDR